jgi:hypothetical protein
MLGCLMFFCDTFVGIDCNETFFSVIDWIDV